MPESSLERIQTLVQRTLDAVELLREDVRPLCRRVGRVERALLALQRAQVDRLASETAEQDAIDALTNRLERGEERVEALSEQD